MTADPPAVPPAGAPRGAPTGPVPDGASDHDAVRHGLLDARTQALHRLAGLTGHFSELVAASRDSNADDEHDPEGQTIAFERSQLDSSVARARAGVVEIDAALARLDAGTYGRCEACGRPVAPGRLEALPMVRTCITCAGRSGRG